MSLTDKALKVVAERPVGVPAVLPPPLFSTDAPRAAEASAPGALLAQLALHGRVATPLCIGLFGSAGSGKSSLLRATLQAATALRGSAEAAGLATPFQAETAVVPVTLVPGSDPAATILAAVQNALAATHPKWIAEAGQPDADPQATAEAARERLDQVRQRLDTERRRLDELTARQARLTETVLFESSGSQVDAYARANRGRIDRSLRRFGFGDDTMLAYKELVRDDAEAGAGSGLRWLSAVWAYRGQARLIAVAVGFFVLFWLLGWLIDSQGTLNDALRASNERLAPLADWLSAHAPWLVPLRQIAGLAGLAALFINGVRAVRFVQPVARGARLLRGDIEARRRDIDGLVAHQAQRVETLARDAEQASARAAEAEGRLARDGAAWRPNGAVRAAAPTPFAAAQAFFSTFATAPDGAGDDRSKGEGPARLLVGIDGFERLSSREAAQALDVAHALLSRETIVTVVALDRAHLAGGFSETDPALATAIFDRIVQVPVAVGSETDASDVIRSLLQPEQRRTEADPDVARPDATQSALDRPWLAREAAVLEALAPYAGETPRAIKRFVNLYRVARADPAMAGATQPDFAALALGLAMQPHGVLPESFAGGSPLDGDLQAARHAAATALGTALDLNRDGRGLSTARRYRTN